MRRPSVRAEVVVIAHDDEPGHRTEELRRLLAALELWGHPGDLVLVASGALNADLATAGRPLPLDRYRTSGLGGVLGALRLPRFAARWKGIHARRALRARRHLPWIVHDHRVMPLVELVRRPSKLAVCLPAGLAAGTTTVERGVDAWILLGGSQGAVQGEVVDLRSSPGGMDLQDRPGSAPERWPVLLAPTAGTWATLNHTVEVAMRLLRERPGLPICWLVADDEDRWLAMHDLRRSGLEGSVQLCAASELEGEPLRMVVHTGLAPAIDQVTWTDPSTPVLGFWQGPNPPGPRERWVGPLDVEGLVGAIDRALEDPQLLEEAQDGLRRRHERRLAFAAEMARLQAALGLEP